MLNFNAEADQVTTDHVVEDLLAHIPVEGIAGRRIRRSSTKS